jgi:hypothetical protein
LAIPVSLLQLTYHIIVSGINQVNESFEPLRYSNGKFLKPFPKGTGINCAQQGIAKFAIIYPYE